MKLVESQTVELKINFVDGIKKEIIAFANSIGGIIYVGIDDNGTVQGINENDVNSMELKIFNWLRDGIERNLTNFVKTELKVIDGKYVFLIKIDSATQKPYFLSDKGPKPSGVYIRVGNSIRQATFEEILQMQLESANINFELTRSPVQNLTFSYIADKFKAKNIEFCESKYKTLNFIGIEGDYTYAAYLFSDQNELEIKCGKYIGIDRVEFESKKEFKGSILKQTDNILDYLNILNEVTVKFDGSPQRIEIPNYPKTALREAILNAMIHRDYMPTSNIKLEFFDDRLEITSPGTLLKGLSIEEVLNGTSKLRNPSITKVFEMLDYVEAYGTGFKRIFDAYSKFEMIPEIIPMSNFFRIIMPNIKYDKYDGLNVGLSVGLNVGLNDLQHKIVLLMKDNPFITQKEIAIKLEISTRSVERNVAELKLKNIIIKKGSKKNGMWCIIAKS